MQVPGPPTLQAAPVALPPLPPELGSFVAVRRVAAATADLVALLVLGTLGALVSTQLHASLLRHEIVVFWATNLLFLATLACASLARSAYRRWRTPIVLLVRAGLAVQLAAVDHLRLLKGIAPLWDSNRWAGAGPVLDMAVKAGVLGLGQASWILELPPMTGAALQLASVVLLASTNSSVCAGPYMADPRSQALVAAAFRLLQPAVAVLEPLLQITGVGRHHPCRQCICVMAALQFWGALVVPVLLCWHRQVAAYMPWRRQQRQLWRQAVQQQLSQQARDATAAARQRLPSFPIPMPSSLRRSTSSRGSSHGRRSTSSRGATGSGGRSTSSCGATGSGGRNSSGRSSPKSTPKSTTKSTSSGPPSSRWTATTSPHTSLSTGSVEEVAALFGGPETPAELLRRLPSARRLPPHPEDAQYEQAAMALRELHPNWKHGALTTFLVLHLYSWHLMLFPAASELN